MQFHCKNPNQFYLIRFVNVKITSTGTDGWLGETVKIYLDNNSEKYTGCRLPLGAWVDEGNTVVLNCEVWRDRGVFRPYGFWF